MRKIQIILQDINKLKEKLKAVKKDMKQQEKMDEEQYIELKKALKEMKAQVKDRENEHEEELKSDSFYNQLREERLKVEEDMAHLNEKLFDLIEDLPAKPWQLKVETEAGLLNVQALPEMRLYINGREEKKRA